MQLSVYLLCTIRIQENRIYRSLVYLHDLFICFLICILQDKYLLDLCINTNWNIDTILSLPPNTTNSSQKYHKYTLFYLFFGETIFDSKL